MTQADPEAALDAAFAKAFEAPEGRALVAALKRHGGVRELGLLIEIETRLRRFHEREAARH